MGIKCGFEFQMGQCLPFIRHSIDGEIWLMLATYNLVSSDAWVQRGQVNTQRRCLDFIATSSHTHPVVH